MSEGQTDHAVGLRSAGPQDVEVRQASAQRLGAGGLDGLRGRVGAASARTVWPLPSSSATTAEPIRPVPPVTKTAAGDGTMSHRDDGRHDCVDPGARERLVVAAVDLFTEQGYDATTVAQIAERAGVTKSTFFRHFPDKRELLVAGQETLSRLLAEGIAQAPAAASPLEAVAAGLERASSAMGPMNRELGPRLKAAVAASAELQERDALKSVGLAAAMTDALMARGVAGPDRAPRGRAGRPRVQAGLRPVVRRRS